MKSDSRVGDEADEVYRLCAAVLDGQATPAETERLSGLLVESEAARRLYLRLAGQATSLQWYAGELQSEAAAHPKLVVFPLATRRHRLWWAGAGLTAAAAAVALGLFWQPWADRSTVADLDTTSPTGAGGSVACIASSKDGLWQGAARAPGQGLVAGERVELTSGFVQIAFDSGASVTLEGPASLEIVSAWEARLQRGALQANVPPESAGFRVGSTSVEVVDLGTEFSMVADEEAGSAEVFVLKGSIEATPRGARAGGRLLLREKESRHFAAAGGVAEVVDRDRKLARFARRVAWDRTLTPAHLVRWSFEGDAGKGAPGQPAQVVGLPPLELQPHGAPTVGAEFPASPWGQPLVLTETNGWQGRAPSWPTTAAGTIAFWLCLPAGEPLGGSGGPLLTWHSPGPLPLPLALGWNHDPRHGALGALQATVGRGQSTGITGLRDGRWHHVAVAYSAGPKGNRVQLKQYLDARLEPATVWKGAGRRRFGPPDPASSSPETGASLAVGPLPPGAAAAVDELVIADRVLTSREIRVLMRQNTLGEAEGLY